MKRPLSPDRVFEDGIMNQPAVLRSSEEKGLKNDRQDYQLGKEKKKVLFSFCEVCNIQLNSAAQAQVHYNGKSHLKRVKQLNNGKLPTSTAPGTLFPSTSTACSGNAKSGLEPVSEHLVGRQGQPKGAQVYAMYLSDWKEWSQVPPLPRPHLSVGSGGKGILLEIPVHPHPSEGTTALPTLVRAPTLMMQPSLDIKPFMSFPVDSSSAVGFFPNFNTMDPVQKAVINHTFGVSIPPKKKQVISCNVCQLRFNSDSQAEAHYKGSKHAKKVKALEATKNKPKVGSSKDSTKANPSCSTPVTANISDKSEDKGKVKSNGASQHSSTEVGAFLPKTGVAAVAPVTLAVSSNSTNGAPSTTSESEEEKAKKLLYCSLCKVAVNSLSQLEAHNTGSKHKTMVEARNGAGPIKSYPRPGSRLKVQNGSKGSGLQNKTFHCEICDVHVNSEIQLKQHISSRRHKDRVAGKPMKPKYSPYNKLQRSPSILAAKLAFQKDMIKPLAPAFLSSPLAAAVSSALSLPARPAASLFQAPAIPPALLRPGHGPIRATPASILFAPY